MKRSIPLLLSFILISPFARSQKEKSFQVLSPDQKIRVSLSTGMQTTWSVSYSDMPVISPSAISLTLDNKEVLGQNTKVFSAKQEHISNRISTPFYKKQTVDDTYNQLTITFKGNYGVIIRVYNDGAAYRFFTKRSGELTILSEEANFNFDKDYKALIPYIREPRYNNDPFQTSFESLYEDIHLSGFAKDTIAFLPQMVMLDNNIKAVLLEADLQDYPGMLTKINRETKQGLQGVFAAYPVEEKHAGMGLRNIIVTKRAGFIARVNGSRNFPWRVVVISNNDAALANNDMIQNLAPPSRLTDVSWIKPGKVAWDWWNDWNISHVDFKAGINTATYKYYIDFAAANKLEYIVLDEGWSSTDDLMKVNPDLNLKELIDYGQQKNVGVILWTTWYAVTQKMKEAFSHYSEMGIKGFKMDFMDRDDQKLVSSLYEIAQSAAENKLLLDLHGMYKPTGMQREYPNVINFEGVRGMENVKWAPADDVPRYDVTIPYIRMMAGPMDYTPGAMRNASRQNFRPVNSMPMSQGTRCHQMAMYVVFEAPLQMLADNPTAYMKEQECTSFISKVPTVFDETVALDGKVGEFISIAREKDNSWYAGGMTNWTPRDITIDFSFLGAGNFEAELFTDGINAPRDATDYKKQIISIDATKKLTIHLAPGGGYAMRITKQ